MSFHTNYNKCIPLHVYGKSIKVLMFFIIYPSLFLWLNGLSLSKQEVTLQVNIRDSTAIVKYNGGRVRYLHTCRSRLRRRTHQLHMHKGSATNNQPTLFFVSNTATNQEILSSYNPFPRSFKLTLFTIIIL